MEILTEEEAQQRPAGKGQDEPNDNPRLEPPKRPETSFLWFMNPWKALKMLIWKKYKWWIITGLLSLLLIAFLFMMFYTMPEVLNRKIWWV
jgi:hypothetical protein